MKTFRNAVLVTALSAGVIFGVLVWVRPAPGAIQTFRVVAPADGSVFQPGETVSFVLTADEPLRRTLVSVPGAAAIEEQAVLTPMLTLPDGAAGDVDVIVLAEAVSGARAQAVLSIRVEPQVGTIARLVAPETLRCRVGEERLLDVRAVLTSGKAVDVAFSSLLTLSSLVPGVATAEQRATDRTLVVSCKDFGVGILRSDLAGFTSEIRVEVAVPNIRGDINGDDRLDTKDAAVISAANGRRANPEDPRDLNGDGMIDKLDLEVLKGLACAAASNSGTAPGGGSAKTDCLSEWSLPDGALLDPKKCVPAGKQWCVDGSPCDADGQKDGVCSFALRVALNVQDPRLPKCSAATVEVYSILRPSATDALKRPEDAANLAALTSALAALGGPPLSGSTYTDEILLRVPLKVRRKGLAKSTKTIKLLVGGSGGIEDSDTLKLTCLPPPLV